MSIQPVHAASFYELSSLMSERRQLWKEQQELLEEGIKLEYDDPRYLDLQLRNAEIQCRLNQITLECDLIDAAMDDERRRFRRPSVGLAGLVSRTLPPLPSSHNLVQPTKDSFQGVRSYRLKAFLLLIGAVVALIALSISFPWMSVSPYMLMNSWLVGWLGDFWGVIYTGCAAVVLVTVLSTGTKLPYNEGKFLDQAAMFDEQWFRMGAEGWTFGQRLYSGILFGFMHIMNLFYPISSLLVVTLVGFVYMLTYLQEYKRSGSSERAVLVSAKLHATYNRFAFVYMLVALAVASGLLMLVPLS